jgi:hypothetical protein
VLPERHTEKFLVEPRRAVDVGNPYGNVIQAHGSHSRLACRGLRAANRRVKRKRQLTAAKPAAFEVADQLWMMSCMELLSSVPTVRSYI